MIQKLEHCVRGTDYGCGGASFSEVIDKVNEVIDHINSLPEEKPSKDLELTWEDMRAIRIIKDHLTASINGPMWDSKEFYEEILRRFNKAKNKK